eukprot:241602_1
MLASLHKRWLIVTKVTCADLLNQTLQSSALTSTGVSIQEATPPTTCTANEIKGTLNQIISGSLKIDVALQRFVQIFDDINTINHTYTEIQPVHLAQFIVYFLVCVIVENKNRTNDQLIAHQIQNEYERNGNILLTFLLNDFLPHLRVHHVSFHYLTQKRNAINRSLLHHLNNTHERVAELIMDYMDHPMYDVVKVVVLFVHYAQKKSYFQCSTNYDIKITEFNTIPLLLFDICSHNLWCNHNQSMLWLTTRVLLNLFYRNEGKPYKKLSLLVNKYHPMPFYEYPEFWMDLIRFHFGYDEEEISLFFRRIFWSDTCPWHVDHVGFSLFYPFGHDDDYGEYERMAINYATQRPKYEYLYDNVICKYLLKDLNTFHWFLIEFVKYSVTLWQLQRKLHNYSESAYAEFISLFLCSVDNEEGIAKINKLYPPMELNNPANLDFANSAGILTLPYHFKRAITIVEGQHACKAWEDLVTFIRENGWVPRSLFSW